MSEEKNTVRFALVGAGGIAQAYGEAFAQSDHADLIAVADIREEAAEALAEKSGAHVYPTHTEILDNERHLDALIICTPPTSHTEIACEALMHGIHVLCEKPLSVTSADARRMAKAAEENDRILTMASKFRYVEDVSKAKAIVDSGELGEVVLFENAFTSFVDMSRRWNANPEISGGGVLIDNGTHSLDLSRFFLGPLAEVEVVEGRRTQKLPVEETVTIFARSRTGVLANIDLSWTINKSLDHYIRIFGSKGELFLGWRASKYRVNGGEWQVFGTGYNKTEAFLNQIHNFAGAIRGEEELLITARDGIASVEAVEAAYRALEDNSAWHQVSPALPITA